MHFRPHKGNVRCTQLPLLEFTLTSLVISIVTPPFRADSRALGRYTQVLIQPPWRSIDDIHICYKSTSSFTPRILSESLLRLWYYQQLSLPVCHSNRRLFFYLAAYQAVWSLLLFKLFIENHFICLVISQQCNIPVSTTIACNGPGGICFTQVLVGFLL